MTQTDVIPADVPSLQRTLVDRLFVFRRHVRNHLLAEGAARVAGQALALAVLSLLVDRWLRLGLGMRLSLLLVAVGWLLAEAWRHVVWPLRLKLGPVDLATLVDARAASRAKANHNGNGNGRPNESGTGEARTGNGRLLLAPRVASVLELPRLLGPGTPASDAMVHRAVVRSHESLAAVDFEQYLDRHRLKQMLAAISACVIVPLIFAAAAPSTAALWAKRWFFGSNQPWPQRTYLAVAGLSDGRLVVPRDESAVLRVSLRDHSVDPGAVSLRLRNERGDRTDAPLTRFGPGDYRFDLPPLQGPAGVELSGGDDRFGPFTVDPVERPRIIRFDLASRHPTEAAETVRSFSGQESENAFLPKTELELRFTSNVPVAEARVRGPEASPARANTTQPGTSQPGPSHPGPSQADLRRASEREFALKWVHERPVQLEVELVGAAGGLTSLPTPISIGLKNDQPPRVTLQYTGVRQRVSPQARIPLVVHSRDDYGVAKVDLLTKVEAAPAEPEPKAAAKAPAADAAGASPATAPATKPAASAVALFGPANPAKEVEVRNAQEMQLAAMGLNPGALLSLTGRASDACYLGPQTAQSRTVTFRVVRPEELFREILLRQQAERAKFRKALGEAEKIRDLLATLATRESAARVAGDHRLVQRESRRVATSLLESLTEMRLNALGGEDAYNLMENSILRPLDTLDKELMDPQRQAMDKLGDASDATRVADASARQEQIVQKMKDILKQMAQWDSFVDVLNQLNEIIRVEEGVRKTTEQIKDKEAEGLFEK
jgi:hypothetical protein